MLYAEKSYLFLPENPLKMLSEPGLILEGTQSDSNTVLRRTSVPDGLCALGTSY